jgi:two-component system KDP operon response regulator KdpE
MATQPLVLVVEDDPRMERFLLSALATLGFRSLRASTQSVALAVRHEPDLVLLDVGSPGMDAVGLTARLREWTQVPILVIVGRGRERERVELLDAGATDYITKPFGAEDLLGRMRVWLRHVARTRKRVTAAEPGAALRVDRERRSVFVEGREVHLTPIEYKLLAALARSPKGGLSERQIVQAVWGTHPTSAQRLREHIRRLRQKIERDPSRPRFLVEEAGGGFRLKVS